jgi:(4-(4-[2-(gamma-L-glutamylamino)ethyl]phenoxymethyl)furan-2-yl)methanamine synthase
VMALHHITRPTAVVTAGCGDFLVRDVLALALAGGDEAASAPALARYGHDVARVAAHASAGRDTVQAWAQVCAPCVAVATLFDEGRR